MSLLNRGLGNMKDGMIIENEGIKRRMDEDVCVKTFLM